MFINWTKKKPDIFKEFINTISGDNGNKDSSATESNKYKKDIRIISRGQ